MKEKISFNRHIDFEYGILREIAPGLRRLVANNPGPYTYTGTNTYIVGTGKVAIIDPGPDDADHRKALLEALGSETISHICLTHTHRDHSDGLEALQKETGALTAGFGQSSSPRGAKLQSASDTEFVDLEFTPDIMMKDGDVLDAENWSLEAVHTPGHAPDHLCFALNEQKILLSGDHVMAWNTSVVAPPEGHMGDFIASLDKLLKRDETLFFPGHGGRVENPARFVKAYMIHRSMRESSIFSCLKNGFNTIETIVQNVYREIDPALKNAAALSVLAHLQHLIEKELVHCDGPLSLEAEFSLL